VCAENCSFQKKCQNHTFSLSNYRVEPEFSTVQRRDFAGKLWVLVFMAPTL
jgi:hypothetical protein